MMSDDRAVFENVPSIILQYKSVWSVLCGSYLRKPLEILRWEDNVYFMGMRYACRSAESLWKRMLFLLNNMTLILGASKGRDNTSNLIHTCREICVISLDTFTIPIRRWISFKALSIRHAFDGDNVGRPATECRPLSRSRTGCQSRSTSSKTLEKSLLRWSRRQKSRKDGNSPEVDAKK